MKLEDQTVYYIESDNDDTVLIGMDAKKTDELVEWFDTVHDRAFEPIHAGDPQHHVLEALRVGLLVRDLDDRRSPTAGLANLVGQLVDRHFLRRADVEHPPDRRRRQEKPLYGFDDVTNVDEAPGLFA